MSLSERFIGEAKETKAPDLNQLQSLVIEWAKEKGILDQSLPKQQFKKTQEEVKELRDAIEANDIAEVRDGIGDVIVTLIVLAEMYGTTANQCLNEAYNVISKRTGKMVDGLFVKDQ